MPTSHGGSRRPSAGTPLEEELREQEVVRANRELAAYFRGRRTEREARGALKIIKAFIRDRERTDPAKRRPLPNARRAGSRPPPAPVRKQAAPRKRPRRPDRVVPPPQSPDEAKLTE